MEQSIVFLDEVAKFIRTLSSREQAKIAAHITMLRTGDFGSIRVKQLDGPIHELIVKQYRFLFFRKNTQLYVVGGFQKKSAKTPLREIRHAQDIFRNL